ncbi:hypothetical protein FJY90_01720 [Candidatus Gottesmanbacteria bacterium]|nr:hypothetical protein [Candidatus Gottesmanbacteria bacterium]
MQTPDILILLEEIVEKVWRLEAFLTEIESISVEEDKELIQFYRSQIRGLKQRLEDPITEIREGQEDFREYLRTYFDVCSHFQTMHQQFWLFVSLPKVYPEVYTFVHSLFPRNQFEDVEPTLVYCPIYNFGEANAIDQFSKLGIFLDKGAGDRVILLLPYVDFRNPMMWTALAHEMGHAIEKDKGIVGSILPELPGRKELEPLRRWLKEFCADHIALRLMGPAYLISFISYIISLHPYFYVPTLTHPQPHSRIEYMRTYLERNCLFHPKAQHYYELFQELTAFYKVSKFDLQQLPTEITSPCPTCKYEYKMKLPESLKRFPELIHQLNEQVNSISFPDVCGTEDLRRAEKLAEDLDHGFFISSYKETTMGEIRHHLNELLTQNTPGQANREEIYSVLKLIEDKPNKVSQIINAGWIQKINRQIDKFQKIFEEDDSILEEKFNTFGNYLESISYNIQKSIETSKIHSLFAPGEKQ